MRLKLKNRFEIKYLVSFREKEEIASTMRHCAALDKHSSDNGYNVFSVYFDTYNFRCYREKIDGEEKRVKFRLRYYRRHRDEDCKGMFLEVKAKDNNTIIKDRVFLPHEVCSRLVSDNIDDKVLDDFSDHYAVKKFIYYHKRRHIRPVAAVQYKRLPLVLRGYHNFRITFDHSVRCMYPAVLDPDFSGADFCLPERLVILEIKFNNRLPLWMMSYIKHHNLTQRRISKYVLAIEQLYQKRLQRRILTRSASLSDVPVQEYD